MGVLNVTPDSFSDGGKYCGKRPAVKRALEMIRDGADIIDVGGESTRPGARDISDSEEISRVLPAIKAISRRTNIIISIDTRKACVAEAAIRAGACMINDISGLHHDPKMAKVAARYGVPIILMHMKGTPLNMQASPRYKNVVSEVRSYLQRSIKMAISAGVKKDKIIVDPGIGFGKTVGHNLEILNRLGDFKDLGAPICVGTSRKSFIGKILDIPDPKDRLSGTIATSVAAILRGANIIRVHDVKEARDAALIIDKILRSGVN